MIRLFSLLLVMVFLSGCAGMSEQACVTSDWRTVGFEDGTRGRPEATIGNYRQACSRHGVAPDLDDYRAGHAEGVRVYCRAGNGFDAGRRGQRYQGVCPAGMEPEFLAAYNAGRHLYELESELRRVDNLIARNVRAQEDVKKEMTGIAASIAGSETTTEERVLLVARAAELGGRYAELNAENEELRTERVFVELELEDYRQTLAYGP